MASHIIRDTVQATLALMFSCTVIYLSIRGDMPTDIIAGLAGTAVGFFLAERKNGEERTHIERMAKESRQ